jgi:ADP-heptose:LPS heptosyltransferase
VTPKGGLAPATLAFSLRRMRRQLRPAWHILWDLIRGACDWLARSLPVWSGREKQQRKRLLVVRVDMVGDFVLFLDAFKEYPRLFSPEAWELTLLGNCAWRELAEGLPGVARLWCLDWSRFQRRPLYRFLMLRKIKRAKFDLVIQPTFSRVYEVGDAVVRVTGAAKRLGSTGDFSNISPRRKAKADQWYTHLLPATPHPVMELERNAEFLRELGLREFLADRPKLPNYPAVKGEVDGLLEGLSEEEFFVLFPGSREDRKRWPVAAFAEIADHLKDTLGWTGVVCGGLEERGLASELMKAAINTPMLDLTGKTSLRGFAEVVRKAGLLIGNDTSAVHVAAAVGTPSVCIIGGGQPGRFTPYSVPAMVEVARVEMPCYGCDWNCIYPPEVGTPVPCIRNVEVEVVKDAVDRLKPLGKGR